MSSPDEPVRIALIHALNESIQPAHAAFAEHWPEAYCFDLLDTALAVDRAERGCLDKPIHRRIHDLADYARASSGHHGQTQGILYTCSAFGPAIDAVKQASPIPVLRPNEAAFEMALEHGARIGLVVTFGPSAVALESELLEMAAERGKIVEVTTVVAENALPALKRGDGESHDRLAAQAAASLVDVDVIVLGQFSLSRAKAAVAKASAVPVLTTPQSAVEALRKRLANPRK